MSGTTPEGARSEQEAARWVRGMFDGIAHRYDLANHLLSAMMWSSAACSRASTASLFLLR